jgi:hypothetical protein
LKKINIDSGWMTQGGVEKKRRSRSSLKKKKEIKSREKILKILIIYTRRRAGKNFLIWAGVLPVPLPPQLLLSIVL